jgi:hypothetical protein
MTQKVNSLVEFQRTERLAILEGRNAAVRLCEALKRRSTPSSADKVYVVEASDEGSIAYAVKVEHAGMLVDETAERIRVFAEGWLECLESHAVYEHLATVETIYESPFLRKAIENIFRPDTAKEVLTRLEKAYVVAKRAAGVALKGPFVWFSPECQADDRGARGRANASFIYLDRDDEGGGGG